MKKQAPLRSKVVVCFNIIIVTVLLTQLIINMFFLKPFVSAVKIASIENSFSDFKNNYSGYKDDIEVFAQYLLERKGVRLAVMQEDDIIYYPRVSKKDINADPKQDDFLLKEDPLNDKDFDKSQFSEKPNAVIEDIGEDRWIVLRGFFDDNGKTIYVTMTFYMPTMDNRVGFYEYVNASIMIVALFIAIIPALIFSRSITRPITEIEHVAQNASNLDFTYIANENISSTELASLAKSINIMSSNLQRSIEELQVANEKLQDDIDYKNRAQGMQRLFIANVSHEMKTPLGVLQLYCENLKNDIEGIDKDYYYDVIIAEIQKLNRMVVRMLDISSLESNQSNMVFNDFSLSDMCLSNINMIKEVYTEKNIEYYIEPDINVNGDVNFVEKALLNYISNALFYSKKNGLIRIKLDKVGDKARLSVFDEGNTIDEENKELIWEPFYRSEQARTRTEDNNVGLGLFIVKSIIEKHGGSVEFENKENGVEFSFTLPITQG